MSEAKNKTYRLKVWRQQNAKSEGKFIEYTVTKVEVESSFLELLDILNDGIVNGTIADPEGHGPIVFDHDCREGICGMCSLYINGRAHGPDSRVTTCQMMMRLFEGDGVITVEPWRSGAFPVIRDLMVDRTAFEKIMQSGGFVSVNTGGVPDGNAIPIGMDIAEEAMDAATCIGCGACVATCKNGSAMLFVSAKVSQLALLPQGKVEASRRAISMVSTMDSLGFGNCTNTGACEMECPKGISISHIARMNREFLTANIKS